MKKDKYITHWLAVAFLILFASVLIPISCKSQLNPTFTSVKIDSMRARTGDKIWLTDNAGSVAWIRLSGDTLYLGDASGEHSVYSLLDTTQSALVSIGDYQIYQDEDILTFDKGGEIIQFYMTPTESEISRDANFIQFVEAGPVITFGSGTPTATYSFDGVNWFNDTDSLATKAEARAGGGGTGTGVVDTAGGQAANQIAFWTDNHTLDGESNFFLKPYLYLKEVEVTNHQSATILMDSTKFHFQSDDDKSDNHAELIVGTDYEGAGTYPIFFTHISGDVDHLSLLIDTVNFLFSKNTDSIVIISDSLYLPYLTSPTRYGGLYIDSITGSVKVDSLVLGASWGLEDQMPSLGKLLRNRTNGEIDWTYYLPDGTPVLTNDWNDLTPNERYAVIQVAFEHQLRYTRELQVQLRFVWLSIIVILVVVIYTRRK